MKGVIRGHGAKTVYLIDGQEVSREAFEEVFPDKPIGTGSGLVQFRPLASDALAVHPSQIKEAIADAKAKGCGNIDFLEDGRPQFTSREQRKQYMKAYGYFDKAGGYGDCHEGTYRGEKPTEDDRVPPEMRAMLYAGTGNRLREK